MKVACRPGKYFSVDEFLLADSGYALKSFVVTPYRQPFAEICFSSARVKIEHVNGILKGRWSSLRGIRTQIKEVKDFQIVNDHILVCSILHNLMIDFNDECDDAWIEEEDEENDVGNDDNGEEAKEERMARVAAQVDTLTGHSKRIEVQNVLLNWVYNEM